MDTHVESTENLLERFRLIRDVLEKVNRGRSFEEILESLHSELRPLIPCDRLSVGFLDPDGQTLVLGPVLSNGPIMLREGYRESVRGTSLQPLIETGATRILNDLEAHLKRRPESIATRQIVREGMRSSLTVPLLADGRPIGVMWFSSRAPNAYAPGHEDFIRLIAAQIAMIIEKGRFVSRLQAEVDRQTDELRRGRQREQLLSEIARAIHSTLDLKLVFDTLVANLRPIVSFQRASILMLTEDGTALQFRELEPAERKWLGRDSLIPLEGSAAGQAIRDHHPLYTPDLERDSRFHEDPLLRRARIRSRLILPLFVQMRPIGTLNLAADRPDAFSPDDLDFLTRLADPVSVAVANSEAYRQIERLTRRLQSENVQLREVISRAPLGDLIGASAPWRAVLENIEKVAGTDATVLITGETGTGKELVARALHRLSRRASQPFVAVHCAALSPELTASELFGHEKGAFTGAMARKLGRLELAHGGTLFLDEIAELPPDMQVKLLRVLAEREFERVGGTETIRVDVRILAATNRSLEAERRAGRFRDDLFFRLNVFPIAVPPLRERREDIEPLLMYFLKHYAQRIGREFTSIEPGTRERCLLYDWPGNVRELENLVERAVILTPGPVFSMDPMRATENAPAGLTTLKAAIRKLLEDALKVSRGKIYGPDGAAALLGLKPSTLQARLKKMGIDRRAHVARERS